MPAPTSQRDQTSTPESRSTAREPRPKPITRGLLAWYDANHRDLPWRVAPDALARGARPDPYHVWLSEVMLQQTTVEAVKPFFRSFIGTWPDIGALAAATSDEVMRAWAGLGYYSRARNLRACAALVAALPGGFPDTEDGLRALPGIGGYTAAAIAAIAFGRPAVVVDGNVERVASRLFDIRTPLPAAKPEIRSRVETLVPAERPGDFAQAMMDLGSAICVPKRPRCMLCPLRGDCLALRAGDPEALPIRAAKADRPKRSGIAFVATRHDGAMLMRTRPDTGLLGGMTEVPTTGWSGKGGAMTQAAPPFAADWRDCGAIVHVFTHFELTLKVASAQVGNRPAPDGHRWVAADRIAEEALPTVMKKAIEAAIPGATKKRS